MSQGAAQSWDRIKREVQTPTPRRTQLEQLPAEEASGPPLRVTLPAPQGGDQEQRRRNSGPSPPSTLGSCPGATTERWARMDTCEQSLPTFWGGGLPRGSHRAKPRTWQPAPKGAGDQRHASSNHFLLVSHAAPREPLPLCFFPCLGFLRKWWLSQTSGVPTETGLLIVLAVPAPYLFQRQFRKV